MDLLPLVALQKPSGCSIRFKQWRVLVLANFILQVVVLEQHKKKVEEHSEWQSVIASFLAEKDRQTKVGC